MGNIEGFVRKATLLALCAALAACGGGGGGEGSGSSPTSPAATAGTASKGVLEKAIVTAYAITAGDKGSKLGETRTDAAGKYSLSLGSHSGPVLLELTVDATTVMTCDVPAGCLDGVATHAFGSKFTPPAALKLQSVLANASGSVSSALTPYTYLAAQLALKNGGSAAAIEAALTQIADLFDLPALNATQPVDITQASLDNNLEAQRYAVMNAAIAQLAGADLVAELDGLVATIKTNNGQLEKDNATPAPSLADILAAAGDVAQAPALSSKLNSLIALALNADLAAVDGQSGLTTASPAPLPGASDLVKAKAFVNSTHEIIQDLRGYLGASGSTDGVMTELQDRYTPLQAFVSPENPEAAAAVEVFSAVFKLLGETGAAAANGENVSGADTAAIQEYLAALSGGRYRLSVADEATITLNAVNKTATFNGYISVQEVSGGNCGSLPFPGCTPATPVGAAHIFTLSNVAVKYPSISTLQSSYTAELLSQGSIQSAHTRLTLQGGGPNTLTFSYASAQTLASHLANYDSSETGSLDLPEKIELGLKGIKFEVGDNLAAPTGAFTGGLSIRINKASFKVADPTNLTSRRYALLPTLANFNGQFALPAGDNVAAVMSVQLDSPYDNQALVSPLVGYVRPGLFSYRYDSASGMGFLKLTLTAADKLVYDNWGWGEFGSREIRLQLSAPVNTPPLSSFDCAVGQREIMSILTENSYHILDCTSANDLPTALASFKWSRSSAADHQYLKYLLGADLLGGGLNLPQSPDNFDYATATEQALAGEVIENYDEYAENSSHYLKGGVSAKVTVHTTLNGKALDVVADLTAQRLSYQGGNAKLVLTVNGQNLTLESPVTNRVPLYKLSDKNGVSVMLVPGSDGADSAITINGNVMGHIKRLGSAYVVRFVDNSLIAL